MLSQRDAEIKSLKSSLQQLHGKQTDLSDKEEANIKLHAWYEESLTPLKSKSKSYPKDLDDNLDEFSEHLSADFSDEDETVKELD